MMYDIDLTAFLLNNGAKIVIALLAIVMALIAGRVMLLLFDKKLGKNSFKSWYQKASSHEKTIYYSARVFAVMLGVCIVAGLAVS